MKLVWFKVDGSDVGFFASHVVSIAATQGKTRLHLSSGKDIVVDEMVLTVARVLQS